MNCVWNPLSEQLPRCITYLFRTYFYFFWKQKAQSLFIMSLFLSMCLSVYVSVCLSVFLSMCLSVFLSMCQSVYVFVCPTVCLNVWLCICLCICLFVCHIWGQFDSCLRCTFSPCSLSSLVCMSQYMCIYLHTCIYVFMFV